MLDQQTKDRLIEAARLAPSADNSQPWLYSWSDNKLCLWRDEQLSGKATDKSYVLSDLAMGCVLENIRLTASDSGIQTDIVYLPDESNQPFLSALINFSNPSAQVSDIDKQLAAVIPKRCTDRRFPFTGKVSEEKKRNIANAINMDGFNVHVIADKKPLSRWIKLTAQAEAIRFRVESLHRELFDTVKFNQKAPDQGMTPEMLAIEPPARPFFRFISKWKNMRTLNKIGAASMIAARSVTLPFKLSPALIVVTTHNTGRIAMMQAGQQLQRIWLASTVEGLAVHPYAASSVLPLATPNLPAVEETKLKSVSDGIASLLPENEKPIMLFRIGYKKGQPRRSARRAAHDFLKIMS